jgi:hypothetical protein
MADEENQTPDLASEITEHEARIVVEFQRIELNRLLKENQRLNSRIDRLMQLLEREQVLRQQAQATMERLGWQPSTPESPVAPGQVQRLEAMAHQTADRFDALKLAVVRLLAFLERRERVVGVENRGQLSP